MIPRMRFSWVSRPTFLNIFLLSVFLVFTFVGLVFIHGPSSLLGLTGHATATSGNLSVTVATFISCVWSDPAIAVSFGTSLNPGTFRNNATRNYAYNLSEGPLLNSTAYNVTNDALSNVVVNISIQGSGDFISGANRLAVTNVSWASNTTFSNATMNMVSDQSINLTRFYNNATLLALNEPIGSTVWYRFWLDIPNGIIAASYVGNYSQQCTQGA